MATEILSRLRATTRRMRKASLAGNETSAKAINKRIEKMLKAEENLRKKEAKYSFQILLLGCGNAGKSTIKKQMLVLHGDGFKAPAERMAFNKVLRTNVLVVLKAL